MNENFESAGEWTFHPTEGGENRSTRRKTPTTSPKIGITYLTMISLGQNAPALSSVHFEMVSMRSGKPIYAPPRLSGVSPMLPLNQFQCWSD